MGYYCSLDRSVPILWDVSALLIVQYQYCGIIVLFDQSVPILWDVSVPLIGQYQLCGMLLLC